MTVPELLELYGMTLRLRGFHPRTIRCNSFECRSFFQFAGELSAADVREEHLLAYLEHLKGRYQERTARDKLRKVIAVLRWAARQGHILLDPARELRLPLLATALVPVLTRSEVEAMLLQPDATTAVGLRDLTLLETLYGTGMRVGEVAPLNVPDLSLSSCRFQVARSKGGSFRVVAFGDHLADVLQRYLEESRPQMVRKHVTTALFLSHRKGKRLGAHGICDVVREAARQAGIQKRVTTHSLRHSFATHLLVSGATLHEVRLLLGHQWTQSSDHYTHLLPLDVAQAVRKCHPRGRKKS